ncbi:trypsin-3-like [Neodiprion virginianus]|uniref:trypsin-3-like n=1 Tax=Neodiprion virginianus TaxID=2961670 RepID=UPI001EE6CEC4|nr:trypsin-3-like [Neodiprion virginianus]
MIKIVILLAIVAGAAPNPLNPTSRIVGGMDAVMSEAPYQVSLTLLGSHSCGGSIISENWVLTAAHCMVYPRSWYLVRAGSVSSTSGGSLTTLLLVVNHPNYGSNNWGLHVNDISLLRMSSPLVLDATRQPVSMYSENEEAMAGDRAVITGWGALIEGGSFSTNLQIINIPIISKAECSSAYSFWGGLPAGQICAAFLEGGRGTCRGDQGSPLLIQRRLAGVMSWSYGCAQPGLPSVYTEIAAHRSWISGVSGV